MPRFIRRIIVFFAALATIALLGAVAVVAFLFHSNTAPAALPSPFPQVDGVSLEDGGLRFEVRRGETARSVGSRLAAAGIIRNRYFWDLLGRMRDDHIRIGSYLIEFPMSQMAIRGLLEEGRDELVRVTVREGATLRATALVMEEAGLVRAEDFIAAASSPEMLARFGVPGETMEGYLFPDTYIFPLGFSAERIVAAMAENFFARLAALYDGSQALTPEALHEIVILASIVEKEYRVADEAAVMAGVFTNRLNRGIRLESCATVVYIITEKLGRPHPTRIFYVDLELPSPFNTYRNDGLPPAPIASPGSVALGAALSPAQTDYLFFRLVNEAAGRHVFSTTYSEHSAAAGLFVKGW